MSLNPTVALDHVIEKYSNYLQFEFRAHDWALRNTWRQAGTVFHRPITAGANGEAPRLYRQLRVVHRAAGLTDAIVAVI